MTTIKEEIAKNLLFYRKQGHLTQKELAQLLGVKHNTVSGWENGTNSVDVEVLFKICEVLNVHINDMYGVFATADSLKNEERELIKKYRDLDEHGKKMIELVLKEELSRMERNISAHSDSISVTLPVYKLSACNTDNMIELPLLMQSRSAGSGDFADDESTERVGVKLNRTTRSADYLMKVSGESMEPEYFDGDIVAVKFQNEVNVGEVGVFVLDGCSYIKRRGKDRLESINTDCGDIEPLYDSNVTCRGLVLGAIDQ